MITFLMTLWRFVRSAARGLKDREFRAILIVVIALLAGGTVFYSGTEGWGIIDSLYFSVITLTTVGYGDMHPTTPLSKLFTILYILVGIGILMVFVQKLASNAVRHSEGEAPKGGRRLGGRRSGRSGRGANEPGRGESDERGR